MSPQCIPPRPCCAPSPLSAFTLLEVLAALALCVLLASVAATATLQSSRALRRTEALGDQALRLRALYAQARLRPAETAGDAPSLWSIDRDELLVPPPLPPPGASRLADRPPRPPRRWTLLTLRDPTDTLRPVRLDILETEEP